MSKYESWFSVMGIVKHVDESNFDSAIAGEGITVVDFSASWCGPCHAYAPVFENSAERHQDITHLKVDIDESPGLAERYEVMSVPTTLFVRDNIVVGGFSGALPAVRLDDLIDQTKNLDMDVVRKSSSAGNTK